jgi:ribosomal protein S18 acetylase RimI-like enzyme
MKIAFQPAVRSDADALSKISIAAKRYWDYPEEWIARWLPELLISEAYIKENKVMKATINKEIVGFCVVEREKGYFEIAHLWVLPAYIGKGIGKQLLDKSIAKYVPQGAKLKVVADPNAEAFYEKQGFETMDQVESYPPGRFLPVMWK